MQTGFWYVQSFRNGDTIYFHALKVLKNGHMQGKSFPLYSDRPRAKAKGKQTSVSATELWNPCLESDVPFNRFA